MMNNMSGVLSICKEILVGLEYLQMYSSFLIFKRIIGNHCYHLYAQFMPAMFVVTNFRTRAFTELKVDSVQKDTLVPFHFL